MSRNERVQVGHCHYFPSHQPHCRKVRRARPGGERQIGEDSLRRSGSVGPRVQHGIAESTSNDLQKQSWCDTYSNEDGLRLECLVKHCVGSAASEESLSTEMSESHCPQRARVMDVTQQCQSSVRVCSCQAWVSRALALKNRQKTWVLLNNSAFGECVLCSKSRVARIVSGNMSYI